MPNLLPLTWVQGADERGMGQYGDIRSAMREARWYNPDQIKGVRAATVEEAGHYETISLSEDGWSRTGKIQTCWITLGPGLFEGHWVEGIAHEIRRYLDTSEACRTPRVTGVTVHVTKGHYELLGECARVTLREGEAPYNLDPGRLTGEEWTIKKPETGSSGFAFEVVRRSTEKGGTFLMMEEWLVPTEPHQEGVWRPVTIWPRPSAATLRLRVHP